MTELDRIFRSESGAVLATLIKLLGDFDLAEEAMQDAFTAAVEQWPLQGIPGKPRAWLISAGRFRAIDRIRRERRFASFEHLLQGQPHTPPAEPEDYPDDRLRLIFTCCHPALAAEAQVALTLRTICGLTTEEISRAFLVPVPTMAQRLVRAKAKIRSAGIRYEIPAPDRLADRLDPVLRVIYLVFTEGYAATTGDSLVRRDLTAEAIRLGRLLAGLMPGEREARALLALMLLHEARRETRMTPAGDLVLLEDQDRSCWDRGLIAEGVALVHEVLGSGPAQYYALQAAIAALHAEAASADRTDWPQIAALYSLLRHRYPSPIIELNYAVAIAMVDGPDQGLQVLGSLEARGELGDYHLLPAARADLLRRLGRRSEAAVEYRRALQGARVEAERRFLERRLDEVTRPENRQPPADVHFA